MGVGGRVGVGDSSKRGRHVEVISSSVYNVVDLKWVVRGRDGRSVKQSVVFGIFMGCSQTRVVMLCCVH